jgi:hypothetical protein
MIMSLVLILFGALCRVQDHLPNLVPIGAIALYAGARLPRRWAWIVPIAAMLGSDLILDWGHADRPALTVSRVTIYATYAAITLLGLLARRAKGRSAPFSLSLLAISASGLFFLTTNFAEWIAGPLGLYPRTWDGLVACYVAALPFAQRTFLADLAGTGILFGLDALAHRVVAGRQARPEPAKEIGLAEV